MCSIRIFAKNMGDPYYEPSIVVHDYIDNTSLATATRIMILPEVQKFS